MKTHNFRELMEPIKADPERRANMERHRADTLAEMVAYNLAELRKLREVTQHDLAEALGVKQPSVSGSNTRTACNCRRCAATSKRWAARSK